MSVQGTPGRASAWVERRQAEKGLRPRYAAYVIIALWFAAVLVWGVAEHLIDKETFPTVWLGMWWALQTVTTVGYGDVVPASDAGRAVATLLLLGGMAFLAVVTAVITSSFVARRQEELQDESSDPILAGLAQLHERLERLENHLMPDKRDAEPPSG